MRIRRISLMTLALVAILALVEGGFAVDREASAKQPDG